jgi:hypothetical protein
VLAIPEYFMLIQCLENIGEGLLHACISSITVYQHGKCFVFVKCYIYQLQGPMRKKIALGLENYPNQHEVVFKLH